MINIDTLYIEYTTSSSVNTYGVPFVFGFNPVGTPQLKITLDDTVLNYISDFTLDTPQTSIVLVSYPPAGKLLRIERDVPFLQESDYQVGRIDPEQIERDFDLAVERDQELRGITDILKNDLYSYVYVELAKAVQKTTLPSAVVDAAIDPASAGTVNIRIIKRDTNTGAETPTLLSLPLATISLAGLASPALLQQVLNNTNAISSLEKEAFLVTDLPPNPTQNELDVSWINASGIPPSGGDSLYDSINNIHYVCYDVQGGGHIWKVTETPPIVGFGQSADGGFIKSSDTQWYIKAAADNTGFVVGLSALATQVYQIDSTLTGHTGNSNNPHQVTAAQVDAYTKLEVDTAISSLPALNAHIVDYNNPHQVTAALVGSYTKAEVDAMIAQINPNGNGEDMVDAYKVDSTHVLVLLSQAPLTPPTIADFVILDTGGATISGVTLSGSGISYTLTFPAPINNDLQVSYLRGGTPAAIDVKPLPVLLDLTGTALATDFSSIPSGMILASVLSTTTNAPTLTEAALAIINWNGATFDVEIREHGISGKIYHSIINITDTGANVWEESGGAVLIYKLVETSDTVLTVTLTQAITGGTWHLYDLTTGTDSTIAVAGSNPYTLTGTRPNAYGVYYEN
jgi:hypothetical protein